MFHFVALCSLHWLRVIVCVVGISEDRKRSASAPTLGIVPCMPAFAGSVLQAELMLALGICDLLKASWQQSENVVLYSTVFLPLSAKGDSL